VAGTASSNQGAREVYGGVSLFTPNGDSAMDEATDSVKVSVVSSSAAGATQYAEDTPSLQGDFVNMAGVVRKDTAASLVDTDGDRTQMEVDAAGRLWVNASGAAVPVTDNAGSLTVDDGGGSLTVDDGGAALSVDDNGGSLTVDGTVSAAQSGTWTVQPGNTSNTTPWLVSISQGGNTASVSAASALKVDGSAVTQPTNVAQLAGTATDTNSGNKSAGTLRVVIATDQPQLTAALKVDGSAVTQPTNVAQLAGTATDTNSGNKSAGTLRVVLATDQPQLTNALKVDGSATTQPISIVGSTTASSPTTATVNGSSGTVIASNANRKGLALTNTSTGGQRISLHMAAGSAVLDSGITLWPGDSFVMTRETFTTAQINGIASAASGTIGIQEFT